MTNPDAIAIGVILRGLAVTLARHEMGDGYADALEAFRESCEREAGKVPIDGLAPDDAIKMRAQAQAIIGHLLEAPSRREVGRRPIDRGED